MAFLMPLLGAIAPGLIGGMMGSHAAAPAAQGAESAANATANMTNTLMDAYTKTYGPAQAQSLGQFQNIAGGVAGAAPGIAQSQILRDLLPTYMPDILRSRAQFGLQGQTDRTYDAMQQELTKRGIAGPAAEAVLGHVREQGLQGQAQLGSDIGAWEAGQTLQNRNKAFPDIMSMLGMPADYALKAGSALPGLAMQGGLDLTKLLGNAATNAAAPYQQMGQNLSAAFAQPQQPRAQQQPIMSSYQMGLPSPSTAPSGDIYGQGAPNYWGSGATY